jgi:hypothetical protein
MERLPALLSHPAFVVIASTKREGSTIGQKPHAGSPIGLSSANTAMARGESQSNIAQQLRVVNLAADIR